MTDPPARPTGFEAYWDALDRELERYPAAPELEPLPLRSTNFATVYALRLTSVGPYRIFGYYSVPSGDGPFPGLLLTPRYGSVNHVPDYNDRHRYAVLQIMHRGQRLANQPFAAAYPGLLTHGIDDPDTYVYRGIVADCLRAAEFLGSRPEVDPNRSRSKWDIPSNRDPVCGVIGDDLALITAARRPHFTAIQASDLMFYRLMEARERTDSHPIEEVSDHLRAYPERQEAVAHTLALFDPVHHVSTLRPPEGRARSDVLLSVGDSGALGGPEWLQPLVDAPPTTRQVHTEMYTLTHEGGTDQDCLDAWMARQLGVEPMSRFWGIG